MSSRSSQPPSWDGFGEYLRNQRTLARLTLRQLAALTQISNPYLSQLERGLHRPSLAVMKSIADALNVSVEALLEQAGVVVASHDPDTTESTEAVIRNDARLSSSQKAALLSVYRSMVLQEADAEPEGLVDEARGNNRPAAPRANPPTAAQPRKRPPAVSTDPTAS